MIGCRFRITLAWFPQIKICIRVSLTRDVFNTDFGLMHEDRWVCGEVGGGINCFYRRSCDGLLGRLLYCIIDIILKNEKHKKGLCPILIVSSTCTKDLKKWNRSLSLKPANYCAGANPAQGSIVNITSSSHRPQHVWKLDFIFEFLANRFSLKCTHRPVICRVCKPDLDWLWTFTELHRKTVFTQKTNSQPDKSFETPPILFSAACWNPAVSAVNATSCE